MHKHACITYNYYIVHKVANKVLHNTDSTILLIKTFGQYARKHISLM